MKCLVICLGFLLLATPVMAGQDPYIAVVGNDIDANPFYLSQKHRQFVYDQSWFDVPIDGEAFIATTPIDQPEICDTTGTGSSSNFTTRGNPNALIAAGNGGTFTWVIRFPKKPTGTINLVFRCGILKPNAFASLGFNAVRNSAAETEALPTIEAIVSPGPYSPFFFNAPFHLTVYRNPGLYWLTLDNSSKIFESPDMTVLDGSHDTKIFLKGCMDKTIVVKLPVLNQVNSLGETEFDLEGGDSIQVTMTVPENNTVDIYCHSESLKIMGLAEAPF